MDRKEAKDNVTVICAMLGLIGAGVLFWKIVATMLWVCDSLGFQM